MIAFILSRFPKPSETFIEREFTSLRKQGLDFIILPLRSKPGMSWEGGNEALRERTFYVSHFSLSVIRATFSAVFRRFFFLTRLKYKIAWIYRSDPRQAFKLTRDLPKYIYFAELCRKKGVTQIHAHWATNPAMVAWAVSQLTGIPFSFTAHAYDIYSRPPFLRQKIETAKFVLTCTDFNRDLIKQIGPKGDVRLSYHGLPLENYALKKDYNAPEFRLFTAARLVPKKGLTYLVEALAALKLKGYPVKWTVAGDGPVRSHIEHKVRKLDLKKEVEFLGSVSHDEVKRQLMQTTMAVLPSVVDESGSMDGIPNILVEALASGVPVVSTTISGIPELVDSGVEGLLVPPEHPEALANAIETIALDAALQKRMGEAGRRKVEALFNAEENAKVMAQWLRSG